MLCVGLCARGGGVEGAKSKWPAVHPPVHNTNDGDHGAAVERWKRVVRLDRERTAAHRDRCPAHKVCAGFDAAGPEEVVARLLGQQLGCLEQNAAALLDSRLLPQEKVSSGAEWGTGSPTSTRIHKSRQTKRGA